MEYIDRRRRAFTLVELLVVIAIVAVLMGLALPGLSRAQVRAQQVACSSNLRQVGQAFLLYGNERLGLYPWAEDPVQSGVWLWMGRGWRPVLESYVPRAGSAGVFHCPADRKSAAQFDSTSYAYSMAFYHSPDQVNGMTSVADNYGNPRPPVPQRAGNVEFPGRKILAGEWLSVHARLAGDRGWFGPGGRRLFLFADHHVEPVDAERLRPANDGNPNPNLTRDGIRGADVD